MRFRGRAKGGTSPDAAAAPDATAAPAVPPPVLVIDALGRKCPIPIIMLAERIREVPVGQIVAVLADDAAARTDVPAWCRMKSQDFVWEETLQQGGWGFHIRRTY
ncbi:tRNA 2-thiouridine synthesizing protein A [Actinomadura pelletieri DSM 43383]|uniref:tRNA 2-thiouridine synthesizing protein A n=1 Tax=Actinomadura pelletieri DSM 43383 TaxID=1120940 RepID=A0A495QP59_9ACTN|nr:sulfurtransferase TusA family protein [Actinomadura pelletieri]RKS74662.1 tRNA 2-thiouridine synthesizing protein A [Actinomadura pelletieri DSM 43383]